MIGAVLAMLMLSADGQDAQDWRPPDGSVITPVVEGHAFTIDLPADAQMTRRQIIDFDIYAIEISGDRVLTLYGGHAANVRDWVSQPDAGVRQSREQDDGRLDFFWSQTCPGRPRHEVHAWFNGSGDRRLREIALQLADSLRLKSCEMIGR